MESQQTLQAGSTVFGADGEKIGTMVAASGSYIVVEKGFFLPKDYYVPVSAIAEMNDQAIYLSVTKDEALDQGWDAAPDDIVASSEQASSDAAYLDQGSDAGSLEADTLTVPVHEERLEASKRMAEAGEVTISKQVVTEQKTIQVPVTEERVRVEWREPTGEVTADGDVFEEGVIEIPVSREEVEVRKRAVQTGEVQVTKEREQRTEQVTDTVRREVVDVDDTTIDGTNSTR